MHTFFEQYNTNTKYRRRGRRKKNINIQKNRPECR